MSSVSALAENGATRSSMMGASFVPALRLLRAAENEATRSSMMGVSLVPALRILRATGVTQEIVMSSVYRSFPDR